MGSLTVRNLNDAVIDRLKAQAKSNHRSLEAEVRHLLTRSVPDRARTAAFFERARRLAEATAGTSQTDSTILVREDRDR